MAAATTATTETAAYSTLSPKHRIWLFTNHHHLNNNFLSLLSENLIPRRSVSLYCSRPAKHSMKVSAVTPVIETSKSSSDVVPTIVDVDLEDRSYPIYIGSGLLNQSALLRRHIHGNSVLVVTNTTVAPLYLDKVVAALTSGNPNLTVESLILPDGEKYKNMDTVVKICDKAIMSQLDRRCTFVALGGGVISDTCGYAANSFVRGVNFIQIPTTFMAQVDFAVASKTRINHRLRKNGIRGIYQPQCVVIDTDTLNTLPDRELASGLAEVIKHGLISDTSFFEWQEKNMQALMSRDPDALAYAIRRFCENKAAYSKLSLKHKTRLSTNNHQLNKSSSDNVPTIVDVNLGDRSYPIYIGSGLLNQPALLQRHIHGKSVLVVINTTVAPLYLDKVVTALMFENPDIIKVESVILPDGEKFKNLVGLCISLNPIFYI